MELIDKATVIAEVEKQGIIQPQLSWFTDKLIQIINSSIEVKEVDLDKALTDFMSRYAYENGGEYPSAIDIAKHFFELGIGVSNKARKGE